MRLRTAWLVAVLGAAACGGNGQKGPVDAAGSTVPADAFKPRVRALCQKITGCCTGAEITNLYGQVLDQAACEATALQQANQAIPAVMADLAAGRRAYRADMEATCVEKLTALSCADWAGDVSLQRIPDCLQIFEGTSPDGAACQQGLNCVGGRCDMSGGAGVCAPLPATGQACAPVGLCAAGLFCQGGIGPGGTCGPALATGAACVQGDVCDKSLCSADAPGVTGTCVAAATCDGV